MDRPYDLVTLGRISIDLYPEQIATPLRDVATFRKMLGGSPTNVAVAASRLGLRTAVMTKVGADGFGDAARAALERFGVDATYVGTHPTLRTPLAFCEIYPPDHFPLLFYRAPRAPDLTLGTADLPPAAALATARALWVTGTGLSQEPSLGTTLEALRLRPRAALTVLDLDHRPDLWDDVAQAGPRAREALQHCTVALGNRAEVATVVGDREPADAARALLDLGVELAVVKLGPEGVRRPGSRVPSSTPTPSPTSPPGSGSARSRLARTRRRPGAAGEGRTVPSEPGRYPYELVRLLDRAFDAERAALARASAQVAESFRAGGLLYVFGAGHSHLVAAEAFYRAGGPARVCPVLDPPTMLHEGAQRSGRLERESGRAARVLDRYDVVAGRDTLLVVSNSGVNAVPVEMAEAARDRGLATVALTSRAVSAATPAPGRRLMDVVDLVVDNHCPVGDALLPGSAAARQRRCPAAPGRRPSARRPPWWPWRSWTPCSWGAGAAAGGRQRSGGVLQQPPGRRRRLQRAAGGRAAGTGPPPLSGRGRVVG